MRHGVLYEVDPVGDRKLDLAGKNQNLGDDDCGGYD